MARKAKAVRQAVAFLRVSTDEQARSGLGLEAQEAACRAWAAGAGYEIVGTFTDAGVSGAAEIEDSPQLVAALAALPAGGVLVVAKRDRLGRDMYRLAILQRQVERLGCRIVSAAGEGTEDTTLAGLVQRTVSDLFSAIERERIRERTRAALAAKRERGERLGGVPLGYRAISGGGVEVNPSGMAAVERARQLRAQGMTLRAVAAILTAEGHRTQQGAAWHANTVARVCRTRYMDEVMAEVAA